jgi:ABC-type amino acid transport substrate-binding protein
VSDLEQKRIVIFDDDAAAHELNSLVRKPLSVDRLEDGYLQALYAGTFDAMLYDCPYAIAEIKEYNTHFPGGVGPLDIRSYNITHNDYQVAVRDDDVGLFVAVNAAIAEWKSSPDYLLTRRKYLEDNLPPRTVDSALSTVVRPGETLGIIAQRCLGDESRWSDLWKLNIHRFPDHDLIEPEDVVVLPSDAHCQPP